MLTLFAHPALASKPAPQRNPFANNLTNKIKTHEEKLDTAFIAINYADSKKIATLINKPKIGLVSKRGRVYALPQQKIIYVHDTDKDIAHIKSFIHHIDVRTPQILIQAKIINLDTNYTRSLGVIFSSDQTTTRGDDNLNIDTPTVSYNSNHIKIPLIAFKDGSLLNMEITALEQEGHAKLIASPELMTLNRKPAIIEAGEEIPYQEATASGATSVTFKKAVLRLKVVPELMPHHQILLHLTVNQDQVSGLSVQGVPAIKTQQMQTQVLVKNKQTLVLGGILEQINSQQEDGVPGLRKIPILGALFRQRKRVHVSKQLLIFVTPRIVG